MKKILLILIPVIIIGATFFYSIENDLNFRADVRNSLIETGLKEDFKRPYSELNNTPFAYYAINEKIVNISPIESEIKNSLPPQLVIPTGTYTVYGNVYELSNEGLYRFILPEIENSQRIVYDGNNVNSLLSAVSWIYTHGNSDSGNSIKYLNEKATHSKIFGVCNTLSIWIIDVLEKNDIPSRLVQTMTLDNWNTYDNSHTMIEVYRKDLDKWVLYDLDNNAYFSQNGTELSLIEFVDRVKANNYKINYLSSDSKLDISNFKSKDNFDYAFFGETIFSNEKTLKIWYERIAQVSLIQNENLDFHFFDEEHKSKIENFAPNYKFIDKSKFLYKFYN